MATHSCFSGVSVAAANAIDDHRVLQDQRLDRSGVRQRQVSNPVHLSLEILKKSPRFLAVCRMGDCLMEVLIESKEFGMVSSRICSTLPLDQGIQHIVVAAALIRTDQILDTTAGSFRKSKKRRH